MKPLSQELRNRFQDPTAAVALIARYYEGIDHRQRELFYTKLTAMLREAAASPCKITVEALSFDLDALLADSFPSDTTSGHASPVGHGSDDDLSNSFNDKEADFFEPPGYEARYTNY